MYTGQADLISGVIMLLCLNSVHDVRGINNAFIQDVSDPNSEIYLDSLQLISKHGYLSQNYTVITEDGYKLNLIRIPGFGPPVLLVHGIGDSSDSWLVLGPSESLAYQLSDQNYDVWIYNARGNKYSKGHVQNISNKQYWNFSYEEMGSQDLPAVIDFILATTFRTQLSYVGFSQGTTVYFVLCSLRPEYNAKIKNAILLAPITTIKGAQHPLIKIFTQNLDFVSKYFDSIGVYDIFADNSLVNLYHAKVCRDGVPEKIFCELEYLLNFGVNNLNNFFSPKLHVLASHMPSGVSTKTFIHYFQSYVTEQFLRFDYGLNTNLFMYGSPQPPKYNLKLVKTPVYLIVSGADWFSRVDNVNEILEELPNVVGYKAFNKSLDFTHLEFVYGARAKTLVNDPVIRFLNSA